VYPPKSRKAKYFAIDCNPGGPLHRKIGGLSPRLMSMTNHDVPFVVSLIWLAALSGGLIFLLLA
jgi:hypothetical protein